VITLAKHWIDGEWLDSDNVSDSINPATGSVLGQWADGGEPEASAAIAAARRAFGTSVWSRDRGLRNQVLTEMAEHFQAHAEELGANDSSRKSLVLPDHRPTPPNPRQDRSLCRVGELSLRHVHSVNFGATSPRGDITAANGWQQRLQAVPASERVPTTRELRGRLWDSWMPRGTRLTWNVVATSIR